jgi:hypothetical protein
MGRAERRRNQRYPVSNAIDLSQPITGAAATVAQLDTVDKTDDASEQPATGVGRVAHGAAAVALAAMVSPLAHARATQGVHVNSPASEVRPWGSPFTAPPEPAPTGPRSTPDNSNSWGRSEEIAYNDRPIELARVQLDKSQPLTVTVTTVEPAGVAVTGIGVSVPLTVWATITVGAGSSSVARDVRVDSQLSVPVDASYVQVTAWLGTLAGVPVAGDAFTTVPPPAQVSVQVARGVRGLPVQATRFLAGVVNSSQIVEAPCRIASIAAHLITASGGAEQFLQAFDQLVAPSAAQVPIAEWPLGTTPETSAIGDLARFLSPMGWSQGLWLAVSSTGGSFTPTGAEAWVATEVVQL